MIQDIFNEVKIVPMYFPILVAPTIGLDSDACGVAGYEAAMFTIYVGASGDTISGALYLKAELIECATVGGTYTVVADTDIIGADTNDFALVDDPGDEELVYSLGYKGTLPFVKIRTTVVGTMTNGIDTAMWATLGYPRVASVANAVTP